MYRPNKQIICFQGDILVSDASRNGLKWKLYWKFAELPVVAANPIPVTWQDWDARYINMLSMPSAYMVGGLCTLWLSAQRAQILTSIAIQAYIYVCLYVCVSMCVYVWLYMTVCKGARGGLSIAGARKCWCCCRQWWWWWQCSQWC